MNRFPVGLPDELLMFAAGDADRGTLVATPRTCLTSTGRKMPRAAGRSGARSRHHALITFDGCVVE